MSNTDNVTTENSLITTYVEETIPTAQYANVKISHSVTRIVPADELESELDTNYELADSALQRHRQVIVDELEKGN